MTRLDEKPGRMTMLNPEQHKNGEPVYSTPRQSHTPGETSCVRNRHFDPGVNQHR